MKQSCGVKWKCGVSSGDPITRIELQAIRDNNLRNQILDAHLNEEGHIPDKQKQKLHAGPRFPARKIHCRLSDEQRADLRPHKFNLEVNDSLNT